MKTKDVVLEKSNWKQTRQSLSHVSEAGNSGSVPSTYAAAYSQTSPYYNSSTSYGNYSGLSGFAKDINEIIEVSKSIRELIDRKDEDGVCYYSFHDEVAAARTVQGKLDTLMRYACQVEIAIENQIDHKFYEEIDRVIYDLEQLQIQKYKTKNIIGYQRKETITDEYGQPMEYMVIPKDVSITDLYSVDNIYSEQLKGEYQKFKKEQPDIELSESDYLVSTLNPRYFSYDSLYEQQTHIEGIRDILIFGGTLILAVFCPPLGTAVAVGLGTLEVASAIGGRDYLTNRKMDKNERIFRGIFGAMDMLPGVVAITKQFEPGRKLISAISDLKVKSINFVKDTYSLGKTKLNAAYNSMLTKIDDFENAIIRQLDDVFVGNSQLRPAFAGIPGSYTKNADDIVEFVNHAKNGTDNIAGIASKQADEFGEVWAEQSVKNSDDIIKKGNRLGTESTIEKLDDAWYNNKNIITDGSHLNGKKPKPNVIYKTGENGYIYETDSQGRIIRAYADELKYKTHAGRLRHNSHTPDKLVDDHAGHIFADVFGGSPELDNLVSQAKDINKIEYRRIEQEWEEALKAIPPKKVKVEINILYDSGSMRPSSFSIDYYIDDMFVNKKMKNINF